MTNRRLDLLRAELADARTSNTLCLAFSPDADGEPDGYLMAPDGRLVCLGRPHGLYPCPRTVDELASPKNDEVLRQIVANNSLLGQWDAKFLPDVIVELAPAIEEWRTGTLDSIQLEALVAQWFGETFHKTASPRIPWSLKETHRVRLTQALSLDELHRDGSGQWVYGPVVVAHAGHELSAHLLAPGRLPHKFAIVKLDGQWAGRALGVRDHFQIVPQAA